MNIHQKAEQLVRTGQARDYYEACSMLGRRQRPRRKTLELQRELRMPYRDD